MREHSVISFKWTTLAIFSPPYKLSSLQYSNAFGWPNYLQQTVWNKVCTFKLEVARLEVGDVAGVGDVTRTEVVDKAGSPWRHLSSCKPGEGKPPDQTGSTQ